MLRPPPSVRWQFTAHRAFARAVATGLRAARNARSLGSRLRRAGAVAKGGAAAPSLRGTLYRLLVLCSPHWLLRGVLALEARWPLLHQLRRTWKTSSGVHLTNKG